MRPVNRERCLSCPILTRFNRAYGLVLLGLSASAAPDLSGNQMIRCNPPKSQRSS